MLEVGQLIGDRYQLKQKLGPNPGRQTWLATDAQADNQEVIVKLLAFGGNIQWEDVKLFEREANILKQLNHPRIPKYKDYFSLDQSTLWFGLVQEYIPGTTLKDLLEQGKRFTEAEIKHIAKEVLEILIYLHGLHPPLLHRDIKPSNLVWNENQQIYLVDFGAVQDRGATEGSTFTVVGTYGYVPMEQFGGRAVPASDLYALGTTLIHLLTRIAPADLPHRDLKIEFRNFLQSDGASHLELNPKLINWLEKMTAPALERRFSTAKKALKALELVSDNRFAFPQPEHLSLSEAETASGKSEKPTNSRVQLHSYPKFLEINIPRRGVKDLVVQGDITFFKVAVLSIALVLLLNPITCLLILVFANFFFPKFKYRFLSTTVKINEQNFTIINQILSFPSHQKGITAAIQDVSVNYQSTTANSRQSGIDSLIINTKSSNNKDKSQRYSFGRGLTEAELVWLANEIRDWLKSQTKI